VVADSSEEQSWDRKLEVASDTCYMSLVAFDLVGIQCSKLAGRDKRDRTLLVDDV